MMRLAFTRMLLAIHGQGDDLTTPNACNGGGCQQARHPERCDCIVSQTELACSVPLRAPLTVRPAITVHRIPRMRRVRRLLRALWAHLTAESFSL